MPFRYEMHAHTSAVSRCSDFDARALAHYYKERGYAGLCITDHFFNGNCAVPRYLPWDKRVDAFCAGYEAARDEGEKIGLPVFFGWEFSHHGTDFLTYGLDRQWLLRHPYCDELRFRVYSEIARADGGFLVQAHPFREDWYIDMIRLAPREVDAIEVRNAGRPDFENENAAWYAQRFGLLQSAGSDIHRPQKRHAGLVTQAPVSDLSGLIRAIRRGEATVFSE